MHKIRKLVNVVEDILDAVRWRNNIPDLESEESAEQRRNESSSGQGLKILTPDQMRNRLPISLAQLDAGSSSKKLKNEVRQLLYSLYRSKKRTKQIYKSLIDII